MKPRSNNGILQGKHRSKESEYVSEKIESTMTEKDAKSALYIIGGLILIVIAVYGVYLFIPYFISLYSQ